MSCNELELLMQQSNDELWFLTPPSMLPVFTVGYIACLLEFLHLRVLTTPMAHTLSAHSHSQ